MEQFRNNSAVSTIENVERNSELESKIIDFESYEDLCNRFNLSSRKNGILFEEFYEQAINHEATQFVEYQGHKVPFLVNITMAEGLGYDTDRAQELSGLEVDEVFALSLPFSQMSDVIQHKMVEKLKEIDFKGAIYFSDYHQVDSQYFYQALDNYGFDFSDQNIVEKRARNSQASLSLFRCDAELKDKNSNYQTKPTLREVVNHFKQKYETTDSERYELKLGSDLSDEQLKEMWDLYLEKFDFLGTNHPISMEDTEEDWLKVVKRDDTIVPIKYVDDKIVCFADVTENFDNLYWLNRNFLEISKAKDPTMMNLFFPGIVSSGRGKTYAGETLKVLINTASEIGGQARVLFENTNLSEMYVPSIVRRAINSSDYLTVNNLAKIDETVYRLVKINLRRDVHFSKHTNGM